MIKKLVVANWKMSPRSLSDAKRIFGALKRKAKKYGKTQVVVCPPNVFIEGLLSFAGSGVSVGAQNVFWKNEGSFTGEISPEMLRILGARYVIVGHSERRALGETSLMVNQKIKAILNSNLTSIVCVGEGSRDRDGQYLSFIRDELKEALLNVKKKDLKKIIIAYEPIWAIGGDEDDAMSPGDVHEMVLFIRKVISDLYTKKVAFEMPVLYGGSVTENNAEAIFVEGTINGFLVGRASLDSKNFNAIVSIVNAA